MFKEKEPVKDNSIFSADEALADSLKALEIRKIMHKSSVFKSIRDAIRDGQTTCYVSCGLLDHGNNIYFEGLGYTIVGYQPVNPSVNRSHVYIKWENVQSNTEEVK